jgi:hypothetical protein
MTKTTDSTDANIRATLDRVAGAVRASTRGAHVSPRCVTGQSAWNPTGSGVGAPAPTLPSYFQSRVPRVE